MGKIHAQSGARIVNSCGFDSLPSDLGVYFTQKMAKERLGEVCTQIDMGVKASKGGLSGGTIASMAEIFAKAGQNKALRRKLADPYLLVDDAPDTHQNSTSKPHYDEDHKRWQAPFIMAVINTRIVHRSNALLGFEYGRNFQYDETMWMGDGLKGRALSYAISGAMAGFGALMSVDKSREFLSKHVLPKSGSGPSPSERDNGFFDVRFLGKTDTGKTICTKVTGSKDPGYGSTSQMLAQSALCLGEVDREHVGGGFWTPAAAMGDALIERLNQHTVVDFAVIDND